MHSDDSVRNVKRRPSVKRLRSTGHNTYIGPSGAIRIVDVSTNEILLDKPGRDGRRVFGGRDDER